MTEQQSQGQSTPETTSTPGETQAQTEQTFSQEEVNRIVGQRVRKAADATRREAATQNGFEDFDTFVSAANAYRESEEAAKSETEREREARLAAEEERDKYRSLADTRLVDSELRIALLNAGVPSDRVVAAAKLVDRDSVQVDNGSVSGLEQAVQATVESMPWLMGEAPQQPQTFRAADTTQVPANQGDPNTAMSSFLNQVLNGP